MRRISLAASLAVLLSGSAWSDETAAPEVDVVSEVPVVAQEDVLAVTTDVGLDVPVDSGDVTIQTFGGGIADSGVADDSLIQRDGSGEPVVDGAPVDNLDVLAYSAGLGGPAPNQRNLELETAGIPLLGNLFGGNQLAGEHRDQLRMPRGGTSEAPAKRGLLSLFRRGAKAEPTIRTVSQTDKTRAMTQAKIDRLRDEALKTRDAKKLAEADRLQQSLAPTTAQPGVVRAVRK